MRKTLWSTLALHACVFVLTCRIPSKYLNLVNNNNNNNEPGKKRKKNIEGNKNEGSRRPEGEKLIPFILTAMSSLCLSYFILMIMSNFRHNQFFSLSFYLIFSFFHPIFVWSLFVHYYFYHRSYWPMIATIIHILFVYFLFGFI